MNELLVFIGGFLAAFIGSMSGGGAGFIAVAILLSLGLPVKNALATNAFGDFGFFPTALFNFNRAGAVSKKDVPLITFISAVGSIIGTALIIYTKERVFTLIVAALLLVVVISVLIKRKLPVSERPPKKSWPFVFFVVSVVGGISSAGTGILTSLTLLHLRGFSPMRALANSFVAHLVSAIFQLAILIIFTDFIDFRLGYFMFIGNAVGAYLGSKLAIKKGNKFINYAIISVALIVAIQMLVSL